MDDRKPQGFSTAAIHAGQDADPATGATVVPIYATSTYTQAAPGQHKGYEYSRSGNPTRAALETCLAAIEGGERGLAFASGLAASNAIFAQLKPGDEVVAAADLYGGTVRLLDRVFKPFGITPVYVEQSDPAAFLKAATSKTKLFWMETPTNPLLQILDVAAIADVAHKAGAILVVDNTFASPYLQQPLKLGADLVMHSTTKYLGGHSDVIGGAVIGPKKLVDPIAFYQNAAGSPQGPFDAWLVLRGIKTLAVRMDRHGENAMRLAEWLVGKKGVERVYYPGLKDHPNHAVAKKQMRNFGGMVSVRFSNPEIALRFMTRTKLFSLAESLGGVESLVNHPTTMTHGSIPKDIRESRGVVEALVRLSVGIEDCDDLQEDLRQAME
jgi:cystathionine gamma-lyase